MTTTDKLTDETLEALEEALHWCEPAAGEDFTVTMAQGRILHRAVCELLAHRRASQAAPALSDALREAMATLLVQANGVEPRDDRLRQNVVRIARAALAKIAQHDS